MVLIISKRYQLQLTDFNERTTDPLFNWFTLQLVHSSTGSLTTTKCANLPAHQLTMTSSPADKLIHPAPVADGPSYTGPDASNTKSRDPLRPTDRGR